MAIEHVDIPDASRHEPKGASTAVSGSSYISDGAASGSWAWAPTAFTCTLTDLSTATALPTGTQHIAMPFAGTVDSIKTVLYAAIGGNDATLTSKINGTGITGGTVTIAFSGSATGDVDSDAGITALNIFAAGDYLSIETDGLTSNTVAATVTFFVTRTA